jgi:hypothetical protein
MPPTALTSQLQALAATRQSRSIQRSLKFLEKNSHLDDEASFDLALQALIVMCDDVDSRFRSFRSSPLFAPGAHLLDVDVNNVNYDSLVDDLLGLISPYFLLPQSALLLDYLVRHHRAETRPAFVKMALPYYDSTQFAVVAQIVPGLPTCHKDIVQRAWRQREFLHVILDVGEAGAKLSDTGAPNRAAISLTSTVLSEMITKGRMSLPNHVLRAILPLMHRWLKRYVTRHIALTLIAKIAPFTTATVRLALIDAIVQEDDDDISATVRCVDTVLPINVTSLSLKATRILLPYAQTIQQLKLSRVLKALDIASENSVNAISNVNLDDDSHVSAAQKNDEHRINPNSLSGVNWH